MGVPNGSDYPLLYLFVLSNSVPSRSPFKRYSNRKVCCWSSCDSNIDWYLCLSSWFYSFIFIAIVIFIGKMDCLESCVANWIETYHTISYMTTAHCCSPMKQGIFLRVLFSGLFLSFLLRNTWLWHRFTTDQKKSNIQLPTTNNQLSSESQILVT